MGVQGWKSVLLALALLTGAAWVASTVGMWLLEGSEQGFLIGLLTFGPPLLFAMGYASVDKQMVIPAGTVAQEAGPEPHMVKVRAWAALAVVAGLTTVGVRLALYLRPPGETGYPWGLVATLVTAAAIAGYAMKRAARHRPLLVVEEDTTFGWRWRTTILVLLLTALSGFIGVAFWSFALEDLAR